MKRKRIALDLTQVPVNKTGVGVYVRHLLDEFGQIATAQGQSFAFEIIAFIVNDDDELKRLAQSKGIRIIKIPKPVGRKIPLRIFFEQLVLPFLCLIKGVRLLHSIHYTMPLLAFCKRVVTIHDLSVYLYPQYLPRLRRIVFRFFLFFTLRFHSALICVSEATRTDLLRRFTFLKKERVYTAQLGFEPPASPAGKDGNSAAGPGFPSFPAGVREPFILFIGTIEPRKNIDGLIQAFGTAAGNMPDAQLVISGGRGWMYEAVDTAYNQSPVKDRILFTGFVSEEQKQSLLSRARILVYPSFYEGFGLPVLEGMAAGAPVITSNLSAMPEVAGDGALQIDPHSDKELATAMQMLWNEPERARSLAQRGKERAAQFGWEKTARATLACYEEALA